jgi:hypothetical protein
MRFEDEINDDGITWPIPLSQIPKFEQQNRFEFHQKLLQVNETYCQLLKLSANAIKVVCMLLFAGNSLRENFAV